MSKKLTTTKPIWTRKSVCHICGSSFHVAPDCAEIQTQHSLRDRPGAIYDRDRLELKALAALFVLAVIFAAIVQCTIGLREPVPGTPAIGAPAPDAAAAGAAPGAIP